MAVHPRWYVFADDAGDPNLGGSECFGYALFAIEQSALPAFNQERAGFRVEHQIFHEAKRGHVTSDGFTAVMAHAARLCETAGVRCSATFINKRRYQGYWLQERDEKPISPQFLRNYILRKALELTFDGILVPTEATVELVIDRVPYSSKQLENLRKYLNGKYNSYGRFAFPYVMHVTQADSLYVEALQVADHLARISHAISADAGSAAQHLTSVGGFLRMCTRVEAQPFELHPEIASMFRVSGKENGG